MDEINGHWFALEQSPTFIGWVCIKCGYELKKITISSQRPSLIPESYPLTTCCSKLSHAERMKNIKIKR